MSEASPKEWQQRSCKEGQLKETVVLETCVKKRGGHKKQFTLHSQEIDTPSGFLSLSYAKQFFTSIYTLYATHLQPPASVGMSRDTES